MPRVHPKVPGGIMFDATQKKGLGYEARDDRDHVRDKEERELS